MIYSPDSYTLLYSEETKVLKVFAGWYGGYARSDSWRLSSGTEDIIKLPEGNTFELLQSSGSCYILGSSSGKHSTWVQSILDDILDRAQGFRVVQLEEAIELLKENINAKVR